MLNINTSVNISGMEWRSIGPFRGGRAVAVTGHPTNQMTFYLGCAGGVWKTDDGGTYWQNISDGFFKTSAVGAIAISNSDPNILYVGMGEACTAVPRLHWTSQADGIYKSTDGGKTWINTGLKTSEHISRIRIHPTNPDIVYVGVLGHLEGPRKDKGVYKSIDGGKTWNQVLFRKEDVGCNDLSIDPNNPRIIYASMWQTQRNFWNSYNGGEDTSLYRSDDGGETWIDLTKNPGLGNTLKGKIGVSAGIQPGMVWALFDKGNAPAVTGLSIEGVELGGLFLSEDYGNSWKLVNNDPDLTTRPQYYNHVFADTKDPNTVYVLNQPFFKSKNKGKTFEIVEVTHVDQHDLWIDPINPNRMINGHDGGASVSFNQGDSWSTINNQPTAEFYHLTADNQTPYRIYATQQDNTAISVPSRSNSGAILWQDCYNVGSSESGHIIVNPEDSNIVYGGAIGSSPGAGLIILRYDHKTGEQKSVTIWPDLIGLTIKNKKYRFQWDCPLALSPHNSEVIYSAANVVFRSTDEGNSWQPISPDLTRNDLDEKENINPDTNIAPFERCTVSRVAESPLNIGLIWAGSDDGLIHITQNGGQTWENVTPPNIPEWSLVSSIDPSSHDPATVYIAVTSYQHGDYKPYLFKTNDYGRSWDLITNGIRDIDFTRVIRHDPSRKGLLYSGTEGGVYLSLDDGENWESLQLNLPKVPIHDMILKDLDLVVATHGRAIWILDDLSPLHQLDKDNINQQITLFKPRPTTRFIYPPSFYNKMDNMKHKSIGMKTYLLTLGVFSTFISDTNSKGEIKRTYLDSGNNPPTGAIINFYINNISELVEITILDKEDKEINTYSNNKENPDIHLFKGLNRFIWDMRYPDPTGIEGKSIDGRRLVDLFAPPGEYKVKIKTNDKEFTQLFTINKDPRSTVTSSDITMQFNIMKQIWDKINDSSDGLKKILGIKSQSQIWLNKCDDDKKDILEQSILDINKKIFAIETILLRNDDIYEQEKSKRGSFKDRGLVNRIGQLSDSIGLADGAPTLQAQKVYEEISSKIDEQIKNIEYILQNDLEALNSIVNELELPTITPNN